MKGSGELANKHGDLPGWRDSSLAATIGICKKAKPRWRFVKMLRSVNEECLFQEFLFSQRWSSFHAGHLPLSLAAHYVFPEAHVEEQGSTSSTMPTTPAPQEVQGSPLPMSCPSLEGQPRPSLATHSTYAHPSNLVTDSSVHSLSGQVREINSGSSQHSLSMDILTLVLKTLVQTLQQSTRCLSWSCL